jgi:hypothetical protein
MNEAAATRWRRSEAFVNYSTMAGKAKIVASG